MSAFYDIRKLNVDNKVRILSQELCLVEAMPMFSRSSAFPGLCFEAISLTAATLQISTSMERRSDVKATCYEGIVSF